MLGQLFFINKKQPVEQKNKNVQVFFKTPCHRPFLENLILSLKPPHFTEVMFQTPHLFQTPSQCQASTARLIITKVVQQRLQVIIVSKPEHENVAPKGIVLVEPTVLLM